MLLIPDLPIFALRWKQMHQVYHTLFHSKMQQNTSIL